MAKGSQRPTYFDMESPLTTIKLNSIISSQRRDTNVFFKY